MQFRKRKHKTISCMHIIASNEQLNLSVSNLFIDQDSVCTNAKLNLFPWFRHDQEVLY